MINDNDKCENIPQQDTLGYAKYWTGATFSHSMANPFKSPLRQPGGLE